MQNTNKVIEVELWRDITGYNGAYQVSTMGRIKSVDRVINLSNGGQRHLIGHIIQPHDNGLGYQQVNLIDTDHKIHAMLVHKLVLDQFMPLTNEEAVVLSDCHHVNADRSDNRLSNLARVTHRDNLLEHHRMQQIRQAVHCVDANGEIVLKAESMTKMAELLGVSQTAISAHVNSGKPLSTGLTVVRDNGTGKQASRVKEVA